MSLSRCMFFCLLLAGFLGMASAQSQRGQIIGKVSDSTGLIIPGAKVQAILPQTGLTVNGQTNENGLYSVPDLQYGRYTVTISAAGFSTYKATGVDVATATATTLDVTLNLASVSESISVVATPVLLQTESATVGVNVEQKLMEDLPLAVSGNARTAYQFLYLAPTVQTNGFSASGGSRLGVGTITMDGLPTDANPIQMDTGTSYEPSVEAIGEYKMITNSPSAEYGRSAGSALVYSTKSGTNSLHGAAWDYLNNSALDARAWQAASRGTSHTNEFGFSAGGPVYIPKVYNGKNRTFFYTTLAGYRQGSANSPTGLLTLPTAAERKGDFSAPGINTVYDILTQNTDAGGNVHHSPFPGNQIPGSRESKVSTNLMNLMPLPNRPGSTLNYVGGTNTVYTPWNFSAKGDEYISSKNRLSGLYTRFTPSSVGAAWMGPSFGSTTYTTAQRGSIEDSYTISPTLVNQLAVGISRSTGGTSYNNFGQGFGAKLGLQGLPSGECPDIRINDALPGDVSICPSPPASTFGTAVFSLNESLLWSRGKHTFKFGYQMIKWDYNTSAYGNVGADAFGAAGVYSFQSSATADVGGSGGDAVASLYLGYPGPSNGVPVTSNSPNKGVGAAGILELGDRESYHAFYVQDDWKVTPKLTVNAGLRWDIPIPFSEVHGQVTTVDLSKPNSAATGENGALVFWGNGPGRSGSNRPGVIHYKNISPRLGLAYALDSKTVFRAYGGIMYQGIQNENVDTADHTGFQASGILPAPSNPYSLYYSWDTPFPQSVLGTVPFTDPTFRNGQQMTWNSPQDVGRPVVSYMFSAGFQRQIPLGVLIEATYFGNLRRHDQDHQYLDQLNPQYWHLGNLLNMPFNSPQVQALGFKAPFPQFNTNQALYQALLPYPQYTFLDNTSAPESNSDYHAVTFKAEKRFSNGLSLLVHYTVSKQITDTDWSPGSRGSQPRNDYDLHLMKGLDRFDTPQRLLLTWSYELPLGPGKKFASNTGIIGKYALAGWRVSAIQEYESGYPVSYSVPSGLSIGIPTISVMANRVAGVPTRSNISCSDMRYGDPKLDYIINPAAFQPEGDYQIGNAPRMDPQARTCPELNENVSVAKNFPVVRERIHFLLGADSFNLFNRHRWIANKFGQSFSDPSFGQIQPDQNNGPRTIQLRLRVQW